MNDLKYVLINVICFLMLSCGAVIKGSGDKNGADKNSNASAVSTNGNEEQMRQRLNSREGSRVVRRLLADIQRICLIGDVAAGQTSVRDARVIAGGIRSRETAAAARASEHEESRNRAGIVAEYLNNGGNIADQVGGISLTPAQLARRQREQRDFQQRNNGSQDHSA